MKRRRRPKNSLLMKFLTNPLGMGDLWKAAQRRSPNDPLYGKAFKKKRRKRFP